MDIRDYEVILDSLPTVGVIVIREEDHEILYVNRRVGQVAPAIKMGEICHGGWPGACEECPLRHIGGRKESRFISYGTPFGNVVDVASKKITWEGNTPAVLISVTPHEDVVSAGYFRILRIDLTEDTMDLIKSGVEPMKDYERGSFFLSTWVQNFLDEGNVFSDDIERVGKFLDLDFLRQKLREKQDALLCTYRRRTPRGFRWHTMEVVPDFGYTDEHQTVLLYVKDVHDIYQEEMDREETNVRNQEIIKTLGQLNFGVHVIDLNTGILNPVRVNEDIRDLLHTGIIKWDELLRTVQQEFFHPDCQKELWEACSLEGLRRLWRSGEKSRDLLSQRLLQGVYHYVSITIHIYESDSDSHYAVVALQDVDERTRREIRQNQNERRMAEIVRSRYYIMNTVYLDTGMCERVDLKSAKDFSKPQTGVYEYYITKAAENFIYPDDVEYFLNIFKLENLREHARHVASSEELVVQYRLQGTPLTWLEEHLFFIRQEKTVMVNILGRDITEEKQREVTYTEERRENSHIIGSIGKLFFSVYYINLEKGTYRVVMQVNGGNEVLGPETDFDASFQIYADHYVHPDDQEAYRAFTNREKLCRELTMKQPFKTLEYRRVVRADGKERENGWIRATIVLAEESEGKVTRALYVAQNITEIKRKEEEEHQLLKDAYEAAVRANASKSDFLSRMSHDIRTPMNAIIGMTAIAETHLDDRDRVGDCLSKITVASKHLLSLINDVLDMSKIESGKMDLAEEEFNLSDLVQNVVTMIRPNVQEKRHELVCHVTALQHEDVIGDVLRLQRVFMNILGNAVKYTPEGGRIELEIVERPSKTYGYGDFTFLFRDNGIGMSPEYLEKVFEPFSRAEDSRVQKTEGTGLGLAIARNIVQMMNGTIQVESEEGKGTVFSVSLFLKLQDKNAEGLERLSGLPVLVVDDLEADCESACAILENMGMRGEYALTGQKAVERVCEAHEAGQDYFAVLLDWKMPGMDGVATAEAIRERAGDQIPLVVLSAYDWSDIETEARQAGVSGFISKPLFKSRLVYLFLQLVEGGDADSEDAELEMMVEENFFGRRVLLVEDIDLNREVAEQLIRGMGIAVESVTNGQEALERFRGNPPWYYDLIFMDVQMPVMDGLRATETIRKLKRFDAAKIPIIAMTANAFAEDVAISQKAGMNEHICKPLDPAQLKDCMKRWFAAER